MPQVAVTTLIKRIRDLIDAEGEDEFVSDDTLLRWLNQATPRLDSLIARAGWVLDTQADQFTIPTDGTGEDGFELEGSALAILTVVEVISSTQWRPLRATPPHEKPLAIPGTTATHFYATNAGVAPAGATVVHLRPLPSSGTYAVISLPSPTRLTTAIPGTASSASVTDTFTLDSQTRTLTRTTGNFLADGIRVGHLVSMAGWATSSNNVTDAEVTDVTTQTLTFALTPIADETGSGDESVTLTLSQRNYVTYPAGWEEWLVLEAARSALLREEVTNPALETRMREIERDVERMASDRLFAQGPTVRNVDRTLKDSWRTTGALAQCDDWYWL